MKPPNLARAAQKRLLYLLTSIACLLLVSPALAQTTPRKTDPLADVFTLRWWRTLWGRITEDAFNSLLRIGGVLLAYLVLRSLAYRVIDGILAQLLARESRLTSNEERAGRLHTLQGLVKSVVGYLLFFVFGVLFLKAVGFDIMPFITTAGVIGLAVGFGAQKLVKDVISGFFIIVDNMFVVGDVVKIGEVTGQVIEMAMRVTKVQDLAGRLHIVSNGDIGTVTNLSRNPVEDFIEVSIAATADVEKATAVVDAAGAELFAGDKHRLKSAPHTLGITAFSAASVTLRVGVTSEPKHLSTEQMRVREAVRAALVAAEIPLA